MGKKLENFKQATELVVSVGVGTIVLSAINAVAPATNMGVVGRFCRFVGVMVLSAMIVNQATTYTEGIIDSTAKKFKENVDEAKAKQAAV